MVDATNGRREQNTPTSSKQQRSGGRAAWRYGDEALGGSCGGQSLCRPFCACIHLHPPRPEGLEGAEKYRRRSLGLLLLEAGATLKRYLRHELTCTVVYEAYRGFFKLYCRQDSDMRCAKPSYHCCLLNTDTRSTPFHLMPISTSLVPSTQTIWTVPSVSRISAHWPPKLSLSWKALQDSYASQTQTIVS
jgi:hypothetical protein